MSPVGIDPAVARHLPLSRDDQSVHLLPSPGGLRERLGAAALETLVEFCATSMTWPSEAGLAILLLEITRSDAKNSPPDCQSNRPVWEWAAESIHQLIGVDSPVMHCGEHVFLALVRVSEADSAERLALEIWSHMASQLRVQGIETGWSLSGGCVFVLGPPDRWPDNLFDVLIQTADFTAKEAKLDARTKFKFRRLLFHPEGVWLGEKVPTKLAGPARSDPGRVRPLNVNAHRP